MSEAYLIAAARGSVLSLSGKPHAEQVQPILTELFEKSGAPARRLQEVHWHGGDQDFWLSSSLGPSAGFSPDLARFQWPAVALLAHLELQNCARAIEAGERDLVLLAQEAGDQVVVLLLASPAAVGTHNLSPMARLDLRFALSSAPAGLLKSARTALDKADKEQEPAEIQWIASARRLEPAALKAAFPSAQVLAPGADTPVADLFLLHALVSRLVEEKAGWGLLLSEGPQKSGLVTRVERI